MARPREFDHDTVLDRAMLLFWAKGYHATSLSDLCDTMQLNRSSLYAVFGDKRTLFLMVIDRYGEREAASVFEALSRSVRFGKAVSHFFAELVDQIVGGRGRMGGLRGNTAVEVAAHDRAVAASVRRNLDRVEAAFRHALTQAKVRAEIEQHIDIGAVARFLVASTQGLRLIGKTTSDREVLEDIVEQIVRALEYDD